jgi:hypothetical protein
MRTTDRLGVDGNGLAPMEPGDFFGLALRSRVALYGIDPTKTTSESIVRKDPVFGREDGS